MSDEKSGGARNALIITVSSVACALVIAAVIWAGRSRTSPDPVSPGAAGRGGHPFGFDPDGRHAQRDPELEGCASTNPDVSPVLVLDLENDQLDFGDVKQGVLIPRQVHFKNEGTSVLCLLDVETGCGCLQVKRLRTRRYEPGESGVLHLELDTTRREGVVKKVMTITTNELDRPVREVHVRCDISLAIVMSPPAVDFGRHPKRTATDGVLTLRSPKSDPEWTVTAVTGTRLKSDGKHVAYTFETKAVPDARYRKLALLVKHPGLADPGEFRDRLILTTTHAGRPRIEVQSFIDVVQRIDARPNRVHMGFIESGTTRPASVVRLLPGARDIRFEIEDVRVEPKDGGEPPAGGAGFEVTHRMQERAGVIEIRYDGKTRGPGLLEAVVVVVTDDPLKPEVRIPVSATIRRRR